jgi:hypothetical protein
MIEAVDIRDIEVFKGGLLSNEVPLGCLRAWQVLQPSLCAHKFRMQEIFE